MAAVKDSIKERVELPPLPDGRRLPLLDEGGLDEAEAEEHEEDAEHLADLVSSTGARVWPCAAALCRWLAQHADAFKGGARVLELGSGTGAVGVYAAALGAPMMP